MFDAFTLLTTETATNQVNYMNKMKYITWADAAHVLALNPNGS
jgi:hypothetical protein